MKTDALKKSFDRGYNGLVSPSEIRRLISTKVDVVLFSLIVCSLIFIWTRSRPCFFAAILAAVAALIWGTARAIRSKGALPWAVLTFTKYTWLQARAHGTTTNPDALYLPFCDLINEFVSPSVHIVEREIKVFHDNEMWMLDCHPPAEIWDQPSFTVWRGNRDEPVSTGHLAGGRLATAWKIPEAVLAMFQAELAKAETRDASALN